MNDYAYYEIEGLGAYTDKGHGVAGIKAIEGMRE
jgi:hypothetical protein